MEYLVSSIDRSLLTLAELYIWQSTTFWVSLWLCWFIFFIILFTLAATRACHKNSICEWGLYCNGANVKFLKTKACLPHSSIITQYTNKALDLAILDLEIFSSMRETINLSKIQTSFLKMFQITRAKALDAYEMQLPLPRSGFRWVAVLTFVT